MATYEPFLIAPPWVRERVETQGLTIAAQVLREEVASASENGDSTSANAFQMWVNTIESSAQYPGTASVRATILHLTKK